MQSQPVEIPTLSKTVLGRGREEREHLEALLTARRYEEALDLVAKLRESSPSDDAILARCVTLLEERLLRRYLRAIDPASTARVVASPEHPAWGRLSPQQREIVEQVDGRASFDEIAGACGAGRFNTYRAMMHLIHEGLVGASAPRVAVADQTAILPQARSRTPSTLMMRQPARGRRISPTTIVLSAVALLAVAGSLWMVVRGQREGVLPAAAQPVTTKPSALPVLSTAAVPIAAPVREAAPPAAPPPVETVAATQGSTQRPVAPALDAAHTVLDEKTLPAAPPARPAPRRVSSRIAIDGLSVLGGATGATVAEAVRRQLGALEGCHARHGRGAGDARAVMVFDRTGRVTQAAVGKGVNPDLRQCVRDVLLRVRSAEEGRANFTLRFGQK